MELFITFGQRYAREIHPVLGPAAHPEGYLRVINLTVDWAQARAYIVSMIGIAWAFDYAEPPEEQFFPRGEIARLNAACDELTVHAASRLLHPLNALK